YLVSGYISYSQGANPNGFPVRRNHYILHEMANEQLAGYIEGLSVDLKQEKNDIFKNRNKDMINIANNNNDNHGRFQMSRNACNFVFPKIRAFNKNTNPRVLVDHFFSSMSHLPLRERLEKFERHSKKFHYIISKIIESKNEGPIVVHSEWVYNGIVPMANMLRSLNWNLLSDTNRNPSQIASESIRKGIKNFAIWSNTAQKH